MTAQTKAASRRTHQRRAAAQQRATRAREKAAEAVTKSSAELDALKKQRESEARVLAAASEAKARIDSNEDLVLVPPNSWGSAVIRSETEVVTDCELNRSIIKCTLERYVGPSGPQDTLRIDISDDVDDATFALRRWDDGSIAGLIDALVALRVAARARSL
jgi:hypothetical protein